MANTFPARLNGWPTRLNYAIQRRHQGNTLMATGMPVIIVTNRGHKTGAIRKTPLMRVTDGDNTSSSLPKAARLENPAWYYNLKADPDVEIATRPRLPRCACEVVDPAERTHIGTSSRSTRSQLQKYQENTKPSYSRFPGRTGKKSLTMAGEPGRKTTKRF